MQKPFLNLKEQKTNGLNDKSKTIRKKYQKTSIDSQYQTQKMIKIYHYFFTAVIFIYTK